MKFIGHLDIMRYFQKCMRRGQIPIKFTEGFSPHMVMSFAAPLGVGLTSNGEYMDIEITEPISSKDAVAQLNAAMVDGMKVLSFKQIEEGKAGKAMSLVAAADYTVSFREGKEPDFDWKPVFEKFLTQDSITVIKKTKKSETETDIKPMILSCQLRESDIFFSLATGSAANLKPELVMEAFASYAGFELPQFALQVQREEVYANTGTEEKPCYVSLESLGEDIVL